MKQTYLAQGGTLLLLLALSTTGVLAQTASPKAPTASPIATASPAATTSPGTTASPAAKASARAEAKATRLAEAKLKTCQEREPNLKKRSDELVKNSTIVQQKFSAITTRVTTYYTTKLVPAGKTLSNYEVLNTAVALKQSALSAAMAKAQTALTNFNCTGEDPKTQLALFRTAMKEAQTALHEYRTALKNLIVAVRTLAPKTAPTTSPSTSAAPTATTSPSEE